MIRPGRTTLAVTAALALGALGGLFGVWALSGRSDHATTQRASLGVAGWTEMTWPYPMAPWESSRAFTCAASECGVPVTLLVQAKIGFCNCATGVSDDAELDRMGELHLFSRTREPVAAGRPVIVAGMKGRSRAYLLPLAAPPVRSALSVAYNDRCDAIVATGLTGDDRADVAEAAILRFLDSAPLVTWAHKTLGL